MARAKLKIARREKYRAAHICITHIKNMVVDRIEMFVELLEVSNTEKTNIPIKLKSILGLQNT